MLRWAPQTQGLFFWPTPTHLHGEGSLSCSTLRRKAEDETLNQTISLLMSHCDLETREKPKLKLCAH